MTKNNESAAERIAKLKKEKEAAKANNENKEIVSQLTHESTGEPDFADLAQKLSERKEAKKTSVMANTVKYTVYVDEDVAKAFDALCLKRGDQRKYVNAALKDFVLRKSRELEI